MLTYKFLVKTKYPLYYEIYREDANDIVMAIKLLMDRYGFKVEDIISVSKEL